LLFTRARSNGSPPTRRSTKKQDQVIGHDHILKAMQQLGVLAVVVLLGRQALGQGTASGTPPQPPDAARNRWAHNLTVDGYMIPNNQSYVNPVLTANRSWLHLEARYNYENLRTGSLWIGYNVSAGKKLVLNVTPMIGGVFGRTTGVAPGCEASLTYKEVQLSISNEDVFDTTHKSGCFYSSWPELTYSPLTWFRVGLVAERTKAFHTSLDVQRGLLVACPIRSGNLRRTCLINAGFTDPTVVLEAGVNF
jgi:hypothetical protein